MSGKQLAALVAVYGAALVVGIIANIAIVAASTYVVKTVWNW